MKKGLFLGLIAGAAAATAAAVLYKKKKGECSCYDDIDAEELSCDNCCGDCCDYDDDSEGIPAEKADESVVVADACACGCSEEEVLDKVEETVESDEI